MRGGILLLLMLQSSAQSPCNVSQIKGAISSDARTLSFSCVPGPACPIQFGTMRLANGTPYASVTIPQFSGKAGKYVLFALSYSYGLRIASDARVTCSGDCVQNGKQDLESGEIGLGHAWAYPDGTWHNWTSDWTGAQAAPEVKVVTDPSVSCTVMHGPNFVTVSCTAAAPHPAVPLKPPVNRFP